MNARQAVLPVDGLKPLIEERTSRTGRVRLHEVEGRAGVVEYSVNEHLEVREAERS